jgi:hypothetical protein
MNPYTAECAMDKIRLTLNRIVVFVY